MKIYSRLAAITLCFIILQTAISAQKQVTIPQITEQEALRISSESQRRMDEDISRREADLRSLGRLGREDGFSPELSEEQRARRVGQMREAAENWNKTKQMRYPPRVYFDRFAELLKNKNIHLARLFVEKNCGKGKTVAVEELERCDGVPSIEGGGSLYSFRAREEFIYGSNWWDIHLTDNRFEVGNDAVQTIISDIGKVDFLDVNSKAQAFKFLKNYKPARSLKEIKERRQILEKSIGSNNYTYSNSAAVNFDSTYVLRTIAYRLDSGSGLWNGSIGMDLLVAFKIVGREKDGSVVILWKELRNELPRHKLK